MRRSTYGDGSEVVNWRLELNGESLGSMFEETNTDENLHDFIIDNFQSLGHYNLNQKVLNEEDLQNIAKALGVAA